MTQTAFKDNDQVRVKKTGQVETIETVAAGFFPPIYTKEGGMYTEEEIELVAASVEAQPATRPFEYETIATTPWLANGPTSKLRTVVRAFGKEELVVHAEIRPLVEPETPPESSYTDGNYMTKIEDATVELAVDLMVRRWKTYKENGRFVLV